MKKLKLETKAYQSLEKSYKAWLNQLGYSAQTVNMFPGQLREFLHWLEEKEILEIENISKELAQDFMNYFKQRPNQTRGGGLSNSHINKQTFTLNLLFKYLHRTNQLAEKIELGYAAKDEVKPKLILREEQIKMLYEACSSDPLGERDRAMLSVYYGCGLRRTEGLNLLISDVLFERNLLHIRKAKNSWERYVPMALGVRQDLERYIYGARKLLAGQHSTEHLFITDRGNIMRGETMLKRLKELLKYSGLSEAITLHSLRHTIATHLLNGGLSLEQVAAFLGHRQLDSTQIYTHIKTKTWTKN